MKKLCILLVVILVLLPATALAGEVGDTPSPSPSTTPSTTPSPTPSPSPTPEATPPAATRFDIDNAHIYQGMDKAYRDGYTPQVHDGVATVVLPLTATGGVADNSITVTPDLGSTADSPFVYRNYQMTVKLAYNAVDGGRTKASYLVRLDLTLSPDRLNGVYPVTIGVQAVGADGGVIQQSFTSYVTIADGKDPNASTPSPPPASQPKVIVSGCKSDPSPVTAGDPFTLDITLQNTSNTKSVRNMTVTVSCDSPHFTLQNASDTLYIGSINNGKTKDIELTYQTDLDTPAQRYPVTLTMSYDDADAQSLSSSATVTVDVCQELRVEMETPQIPSQVHAGDTLPLSITVLNMGRSTVYNVRAELSAPGLIPAGAAFMGNMDPGTEMTGDTDVFIGTKDMSEGHESDPKYGASNGTITLIYEDADGQEYTQETDISTTIQEPVVVQTEAPEEEPAKAGQWWISVLIGAALIAGLATVLILRKRRGADHETD